MRRWGGDLGQCREHADLFAAGVQEHEVYTKRYVARVTGQVAAGGSRSENVVVSTTVLGVCVARSPALLEPTDVVWECPKLFVMVEPGFKLTAKVIAATHRVERDRVVGPDTTWKRGDDRGLVWIEEERT